MRGLLAILTLISAFVVATCRADGHLLPIKWWSLVEVIDERTLEVRSDAGETRTITLACIGRAKDTRAAIAYIKRRLHDQKLTFCWLETKQTNWYDRPICVVLDMALPGGHGGNAEYDFPLLNEELLAWEHAPFTDVKTSGDLYGLKARLVRAKTEGERRRKEREERWKKEIEAIKRGATNSTLNRDAHRP